MYSHDGSQPEIVKLFFRIGEVAKLAGVDPSVLRHWESEFRSLRPKRTPHGQRMYSQNDVRKVLEIKRLLRERKFTTKGAIEALRAAGKEPVPEDDPMVRDNEGMRQLLVGLREELMVLQALLEREDDA